MNALLTARLRSCDRCGETAKYQALLPSGNDLLLCGQHALNDTLLDTAAVLPMTCAGRVIRR